MELGKLSNEQLKETIFAKITPVRADVVLRPGIGEDCGGVVFSEGQICVLSTDPITAATENMGKLGVHISCNDVVSSGAQPVGIMVTILAPPHSTQEEIEKVAAELAATAKEVGIDILGGHTEITDAVNRIVLSTTVIGKADGGHLIRTSGARVGDDILLTKWAGLEGTCIIVNDLEKEVREFLSEQEIAEARELSHNMSVVQEGLLAASSGATSMHDVTEGGVLGAVWEMMEASQTGCEIWLERIPLLPVTEKICNKFGINPYRLISSGCMLISCPKGKDLRQKLHESGIPSSIIGKVTRGRKVLVSQGKETDIEAPGSDELYKVFRRIISDNNL